MQRIKSLNGGSDTMKRYTLFLLLALTLPCRAMADNHLAQNEFTTAEALDPGMTQAGIHFTLGEDYKSYYPAIRYGLGALFEVGVKFGMTTVDVGPEDKIAALLGADIKYQLIKETEGIPLDMAVDIGFDTTLISGSNVSDLTFSTIFSKGLPLTERGYKLTPYGGVEMSSVYGSYIAQNDTGVFIFAGLEWKLTQKFLVNAEIKFGETTLGGIGIRFEY